MAHCFLRLSLLAALVLGATGAGAGEPPPYVPSAPPAPPIYAPSPAPPYAYGPYGYSPPMVAVADAGPRLVRRSPGAMAAGIVFFSVGQSMVLASLPFLHAGNQTCATNGQGFDCSTSGIGAGIAVLAGGLVATAVGLPLIVYGALGVPRAGGAAADRALPPWAGAPAGNGWRWTF